MDRKFTLGAFAVAFGALLYLGAVVAEQQRAIEALVNDHAESLRMQNQLSNDVQELRRWLETGR
jgi:hypothetical protein